jgi:DNA-binding CsgD family transcriptional regulator
MTAGQAAWLNWLTAETANLRIALDFSFSAEGRRATGAGADGPGGPGGPGGPPPGLRMTRALLPYWLMTGQFTEGRRWHDLAVEVTPGSAGGGPANPGPAGTGPANSGATGTGATGTGAPVSPGLAWAVFGAGVLAVQQGDFAAGGPLLARATELARDAADEGLAAHVTDARGMLAFYSGDLPAAQAEFESALAVSERAGFGDPTALVTYSRLASVCLLTFELDRAVKLCEECLRRCDELGERWARGTALWTRGAARWLSGDNAAAIADVLACLRIKEQLDDLHTIAMSFDLLSVCLATDDAERTAVLHGASERLWTLLNAPVLMGPAYAEIRKSGADTARGALGEERFDALVAHGHAVPLSVALAVARGEVPAAPAGAPLRPGAAARPLTRRERQIAGLVADGLGNREIAEQLYLSKRTVDSHLEHVFTKLGFTSRTQLAAWVRERRERDLSGY